MIVGGGHIVITIPAKDCGCLTGDVCDCAEFAAEAAAKFAAPLILRVPTGRAPAGPSTSFPTPTVFTNVGGRLVPVEVDRG